MVQWLGLGALTPRGPGLVPGWGTNIPQAGQCGQKKKKILQQCLTASAIRVDDDDVVVILLKSRLSVL